MDHLKNGSLTVLLFIVHIHIFCITGVVSAENPAPVNMLSINDPVFESGEIENQQSRDSANVSTTPTFSSQFSLSFGYRVDQLDWNIAGNVGGRAVNVLSELEWDDLEIMQVSLGNRTVIGKGYYIRGLVGLGKIVAGDNQDSDYAGNDRSMEFSRSNNDAGDGSVFDFTLGAGYQFRFMSGRLKLAPLLGISKHDQNLTMTDGFQSVSIPVPGITPPPVGPFEDELDSTYETSWIGPWIGLDLFIDQDKPVLFFDSVGLVMTWEYHWVNYGARANWNLREDFAHPKSFEHDADGTGFVLSAEAIMQINRRWGMTLGAAYQDWSTGAGTDRVFFSNGDVVETRLNEVNWSSSSFSIGITCLF